MKQYLIDFYESYRKSGLPVDEFGETEGLTERQALHLLSIGEFYYK